ncbi:MAG: ATP-dependent endonuclease [Pirellulales bacterium]
MRIETVAVAGFQCFGPEPTTLNVDPCLTAFVGGNGAGKTALFQALSRLFGIGMSQRAVRKRDFHVPVDADRLQSEASLSIEVVLGFPELEEDSDDSGDAVPEYFRQMSASGPAEPLKARMVLRATWTDDGTPEGNIEEDCRWIPTLDDEYDWDDNCHKVHANERGAIQLIYIPATRNVDAQVSALLKGRLWRAARWSEDFREKAEESAGTVQEAFEAEKPAQFVLSRLAARWKEIYSADTEATPNLRLVDTEFDALVRRAAFAFFPDEAGHERSLEELSDGQRSLFHIALTAATLEVERDAFAMSADECAFDQEKLRRTHLTVLAMEEPENSLSPFFLARIIKQARDIGGHDAAQVVLSSHSAAILSRVEPEEVRYFRLTDGTRESTIRSITLPDNDQEASQFVRLAVRAYPELYFARFVVLGEGDSERLVIPRVADAMGVSLDPSFVPVVPLGGRYCLHFWRLLSDLDIPFATLLDFDIGRQHGGAGTIRSVVEKLTEIGTDLSEHQAAIDGDIDPDSVDELTNEDIWLEYADNTWVQALEDHGVFLSDPLDLDFAMLEAFPDAYQVAPPGGRGPGASDTALENAKKRALKERGDDTLYGTNFDDSFRWYSYLFLQRSKPETHIAALARISDEDLAENAPDALRSLVGHVRDKLGLGEADE